MLNDIYAKADYAIQAVSDARKQVNSSGSLWYHAIGMLNAFYAINEELVTRTQNVPDINLSTAVRNWRMANASAINEFFGVARNIATHQGRIFTTKYLEWEIDHPNDTIRPVQMVSVTVEGSKIVEMHPNEFFDLCKKAFTFMRNGIITIDQEYKANGGGVHELQADSRYDDLF